MTLIKGQRLNLYNLTVTKRTSYERPDGFGYTKEVWRYAFSDPHGKSYVYSGVYLPIKPGDVVHYRATIKNPRDDYGFVRLKIMRKIEPLTQTELAL